MRRLILGVVLAASGCGPLTFDATVSGGGTVQGSPLGSLLSVFPSFSGLTNIDFNNQQDFKNNDVTRDHVQSAKVTSLKLKVVSPANQDFSFIDSLSFVASADGQPDAVVAEKTGIAQNPGTPPNAEITFDVKDVELAPYLQQPTVTLGLTGSGHQPAQDTQIEATVVIKVAAKL